MADYENYDDNDDGQDDFDDDDIDLEGDVDVLDEDEDEKEDGDGFKNKRGYSRNKERITSTFLTKYERARILGTRAL